jgi:hypothetical protein
MYPSRSASELGILLRISRELDVVGDVTAIVDNPSELLAWATTLTDPAPLAWRASDSGGRYVQVSATHDREPIRGQITAVLHCDHHMEFWNELTEARDLESGDKAPLTLAHLAHAWEVMPITPPA